MKKLLTVLLTLVLSIGLIAIKNNSVQAEDNGINVSVNLMDGIPTTVPDGWSKVYPSNPSIYMKAFNAGTTYANIVKEWEGKFSKDGKVFVGWYPAADDTPLTSFHNINAQWKDVEYLTFTAVEANSSVTFNWASADANSVFYKKNDMADWSTYNAGTPITLTNIGDTVSFKGTNVKTDDNNHFSMTGKIAASGDVTSLTNGIGGNVALSASCYRAMFKNCTSLTTVPNLLSTTLADSCYSNMFNGCTGLTSVPTDLLPATTVGAQSYHFMFNGCSNLTNIPDLPATTLANNCYVRMFYECSKIKVSETKVDNYVIGFKLPTSTATNPTTNMFGETSGTFKGTPSLNTQYYIETPSNPTNCNGATSCSISAKEEDNIIVAHINNAKINKDSFYELLKGGNELVYGKDYNLFDGSLIVSLNEPLVDTLGKGTHQIDVKYYDDDVGDDVLYHLNITITGDSPTPSPSPSKKDESCEKVIGPTWHWNNDKGICEDYGVVGTSTR